MDEARRFLRYVTPGLTFAVQAILLFFIVDRKWTIGHLLELKKDAGVGLAVSLFLASGGLGYLLSVIHHMAHWFFPWSGVTSAIDHTNVVRQLFKANLLSIREFKPDAEGNLILVVPDGEKINRARAWEIVTAVWKENLNNNSRIKSADAYATALTDITHSAGATRMGALLSLAAVLLFLCLDFLNPTCESRFFGLFVGVCLFFLHHINYLHAGKLTERFINEVLSDALWLQKNSPAFGSQMIIADLGRGDDPEPPK